MAREQHPSKDVTGVDHLPHQGVPSSTKFQDEGQVDQPPQFKFIPLLYERINEKSIDISVKFKSTESALAMGERIALQQTTEKPTMNLRKRGIVTPEDVYLLLLIDVDYSGNAESEAESLYLQWMVQDVRLPSGSAEVDAVNRLGREMIEYAPRERAGTVHGHVFLLYQQEKSLSRDVGGRIRREGFQPKEFLKSQKLRPCDPVLAFYYETE